MEVDGESLPAPAIKSYALAIDHVAKQKGLPMQSFCTKTSNTTPPPNRYMERTSRLVSRKRMRSRSRNRLSRRFSKRSLPLKSRTSRPSSTTANS